MTDAARTPRTIAQMIETDGRGGAETLVLELSHELRSRGHRIVPLGVEDDGWLSRRCREEGFPRRRIPIRRPIDPRGLAGLVRELRRARVDLVHSHEFTCAVYGAAACRLLAVPHVITMHGDAGVTDAWRRRAALRWAFRHSSDTCAVSKATLLHMENRLGKGRGCTSVIHNGVRSAAAAAPADVRSELGLREGELLILCVGNLYALKGHRTLLDALARLQTRGEGPRWRLAIAGTGAEGEPLRRHAREMGLREQVELLGLRADVPALLAAADVYAMPSLREGLPLALLEAMMAGKPIVASEVGGIPEAIESGIQGLLVPPADVAALRNALERLLMDANERSRFGEAARLRAEREFTLGAMVERYEEHYERALAS